MRKLLVALLLAGAVNVMAAGPVTITVIVSDNDSAETNRVTKIKASSRSELKSWMDEQSIAGNLLKQTARAVADNERRYIIDTLNGRTITKANDAAIKAVVVGGAEDEAP